MRVIFGAIFAGGIGSRMGNSDTPKQYLMLGNKPIIIHTIERFFIHPEVDKVIVLCPVSWIAHTRDLIKKYLPLAADDVTVIAGGATRNDTLESALGYIEKNFEVDADTVILTHDAVRPFVTHRIISENIAAALAHGACDTVVPASDTIVESADNTFISNIPDRSKMYQGQTPQSFRLPLLRTVLDSLTAAEKATLTDACKIFSIKKEPVFLVNGEIFNIKITYPYDLKIADALLKGMTDND